MLRFPPHSRECPEAQSFVELEKIRQHPDRKQNDQQNINHTAPSFSAGSHPVCGWKSFLPTPCWDCSRDHPRVCGEKCNAFRRTVQNSGSPPRVRGKVAQLDDLRFLLRITPACAGKRRYKRQRLRAVWDHPRVCGEKFIHAGKSIKCIGSPPRVRGKVFRACVMGCTSGITPACAGKRISGLNCARRSRDHPRVCGEKRRVRVLSMLATGSPPRVRGKACPFGLALALSRITPACAGKSPCILPAKVF